MYWRAKSEAKRMSLDVVDEVVCAGNENFDHSVSSTSDRSTASQRSAISEGISREGSSPSDQDATFTRDTRYIYVSLLGSLDRSAHFVCPSLVPKVLLLASQSSQLLQPASHARMMDPAQAQHRRPVVVIKVGCDQDVCDFGWHFLQGLPNAKIAATRLDPPPPGGSARTKIRWKVRVVPCRPAKENNS